MRDIKFRFYSNLDKKMYESTLIDTSEGNDSAIFDGADVKMKDGSIRCQRRSEGHLMQYTGLKDKNGVEIYEGDIMRTDNYGIVTAEVRWSDEQYGGAWGWLYFKGNETLQYYYGEGPSEGEGQVIGNIYENPDLLTNN